MTLYCCVNEDGIIEFVSSDLDTAVSYKHYTDDVILTIRQVDVLIDLTSSLEVDV